MTTYCYKTEIGETAEREFSMGEAPETIELESGTAHRDFRAEQGHMQTGNAGWPMESNALGVNPNQIGKAEAHAKDMGVPTHFNKETGNPILRNKQHRKKYCEAVGFYDRNAGHGDPTPKNL